MGLIKSDSNCPTTQLVYEVNEQNKKRAFDKQNTERKVMF
jgi:hypothetical protein